jgi:hypothetical protein
MKTGPARTARAPNSAIRRPSLLLPRPSGLIARCLIVMTALVCFTANLHSQAVQPTEAQVKAAYLYNFGKFVRWPADRAVAPESFEICVLGRDPFGAVLDSTVAGESIDSKKIIVRRLSGVQDASTCSVLFVSSSEDNRLAPTLAAAQHLGLLTVSDMRNFAARGGAIGLVNDQGKIKFEVNREAAEQSHLELSSELLKVATKIINKPVPGT